MRPLNLSRRAIVPALAAAALLAAGAAAATAAAPAAVRLATTSVSPPDGAADLALGRPAQASSARSARLGAAKAVDPWSRTSWTARRRPGQWLQVDLGRRRTVAAVSLQLGHGLRQALPAQPLAQRDALRAHRGGDHRQGRVADDALPRRPGEGGARHRAQAGDPAGRDPARRARPRTGRRRGRGRRHALGRRRRGRRRAPPPPRRPPRRPRRRLRRRPPRPPRCARRSRASSRPARGSPWAAASTSRATPTSRAR